MFTGINRSRISIPVASERVRFLFYMGWRKTKELEGDHDVYEGREKKHRIGSDPIGTNGV